MAISLKDIAARARTYPSQSSRFGRTLAKLAESIVDFPSEKVRVEASAPATPSAGDVYFDSGTNKLNVYSGTAWEEITSA